MTIHSKRGRPRRKRPEIFEGYHPTKNICLDNPRAALPIVPCDPETVPDVIVKPRKTPRRKPKSFSLYSTPLGDLPEEKYRKFTVKATKKNRKDLGLHKESRADTRSWKEGKRVKSVRRERKTVRLDADGMLKLRIVIFERSGGRVRYEDEGEIKTEYCGRCEAKKSRKRCGVPIWWESFHLAHIKGRGAGGEDSEENTLAACPDCHIKSHNCGGKPVPSKRSAG